MCWHEDYLDAIMTAKKLTVKVESRKGEKPVKKLVITPNGNFPEMSIIFDQIDLEE